VFGEGELGQLTTSLFQSTLTTGTQRNYGSNLASFYNFSDAFLLNPLAVSPIDIARYIARLGQRGTVAADCLQPYLSTINMLLLDHTLPPVALGPLVSRVRKGLDNSQEDSIPHPQRLPLPAPVALAILALAKGLFSSVQ